MINQNELAAWAKKTLATNSLTVIDNKNDIAHRFGVNGDHEALAAAAFTVKHTHIHIIDGNNVLGGISLTRTAKPRKKSDIQSVSVQHPSKAIEHMVQDIVTVDALAA